MLEPFYKNKFKQDVARMEKRGKQLKKLQEVISMLIDQHENKNYLNKKFSVPVNHWKDIF